jgi:hypothetical protein
MVQLGPVEFAANGRRASIRVLTRRGDLSGHLRLLTYSLSNSRLTLEREDVLLEE